MATCSKCTHFKRCLHLGTLLRDGMIEEAESFCGDFEVKTEGNCLNVSEFRVREALDKQMPKKANISIKGTTDYNTTAYCPSCRKMLVGIKPRYCIECGQAIDWSVEKK